MDPPRMPRKFLPKFIENENEEELEIRRQLAIEKFKSEIHLQKKHSEKYQERFMKIEAEMMTYLTGHFENNEVCDALIKEWETDCTKEEEISRQIFNKKENIFLSTSSSEYRNKPNRDENANRKRDDAWFEKRKENKTPNRGNHSRSRRRSEIRNSNNRRDKTKSTERIVLPSRNNQNRRTRNKTEDNREKYEQKKRNIFPKGRTTSEKFETIAITTNGNNRNVRLAEQEHNEVHIIPETQLSQNDKGEGVQVSAEKKNVLFHGQGVVH